MKNVLAVLLALLAVPASALGLARPPNYDAFLESPSRTPVVDATAPGRVAHVEERLGVPTFYWAPRDPRAGGSFRAMGLTPEQAARRHLLAVGRLWRIAPAELAEEAVLHRVHDIGRGAVIASFRKELDGVRVFRDELRVVMDRELELVAISGYLAPHPAAGLPDEPPEFRLSHATAIGVGLFELTGVPFESSALRFNGRLEEDWMWFDLAVAGGLRFAQPARARKVLFPLPEGLAPAYHVEVDLDAPVDSGEGRETRTYGYVVSAFDGRVLLRKNLESHAAFTYRVWADASGLPWDGPHGTGASPHPTGAPDGTQPGLVAQNVITLQNGPISTNDPWLAPTATASSGNNVDAYADRSGGNGFDQSDLRAQVVSGALDFLQDPLLAPNATSAQIQASVTQLFVDNNFFHDWYYDVGFDEASGNAQVSNLGRGGLGNDPLLAEAQDFSGTNNANMSAPADGQRPRMQMYIFNSTAAQRVVINPSGANPTTLTAAPAQFGPLAFDLTADLALANDLFAPNADACQTLPAASLSGKIALIERGTCTFTSKVKNAQNAGAVGAIIFNNQSGGDVDLVGTDSTIVIPSLGVSQTDGATLVAALGAGPVTVQLHAEPPRDGTLDNAIVAHEWGHLISNRLIGDATGLTNLMGFSLGEGWGDFHALIALVRPEDAQHPANAGWTGAYPMSTYVVTGGTGNGLYFGLRRVPYSIDFKKNALTFKHIEAGVPLPSGVPTQNNGVVNWETHNAGEVWATMLWECYAALLKDSARLTFQQAQDRMRAYLVAGYKATPNMPTLLEARDAILAAALANDPLDYDLMRKAFARRGAGEFAVAPPRQRWDNVPTVEDFSAPDGLFFLDARIDDSVLSCDGDGWLDNGETGRLTITARNANPTTLTGARAAVTTTTAGVTLVGGGEVSFATAQPFGVTTAQVEVQMAGVRGIAEVDLSITVIDPTSPVQPAPVAVKLRGNVDERLSATTIDTVEATNTPWSSTWNTNLSDGKYAWRREAISPLQHVWLGPDAEQPADLYLTSPTLNVGATGNLIITFRHRFDFEADATTRFDGGVIEIREWVQGSSWADIGQFAFPAYNGTIADDPASSSPLKGRAAYTARSEGYPEFVPVSINLGELYAGRNVRLRFRVGTDDAAGARGWEIDDIAVFGITNTPFHEAAAQKRVCGNNPPIVEARGPAAVRALETATLTAAGEDPDGDPLTFTWTQIDGPPVSISTTDGSVATFVGPEVEVETPLVFRVVAWDGKEESDPSTVMIAAQRQNRGPVALIRAPTRVPVGGVLQIDGSGSTDEDGDALSYRWRQLGGASLAAALPDAATLNLIAPQENTTIRLELVVSDGRVESAPVVVQLDVGSGDVTPTCGCSSESSGSFAPWVLLAALALVTRRGRKKMPVPNS